MTDHVATELIVVRVRGNDLEEATTALRERLAEYPHARVTALTQRSSGVWDWTTSIQLLAAIEYPA